MKCKKAGVNCLDTRRTVLRRIFCSNAKTAGKTGGATSRTRRVNIRKSEIPATLVEDGKVEN